MLPPALFTPLQPADRPTCGPSSVSYLFRTTGQVLGVSLSATLLQALLERNLRARIADEQVRLPCRSRTLSQETDPCSSPLADRSKDSRLDNIHSHAAGRPSAPGDRQLARLAPRHLRHHLWPGYPSARLASANRGEPAAGLARGRGGRAKGKSGAERERGLI